MNHACEDFTHLTCRLIVQIVALLKNYRHQLYNLSRSRSFLWKLCIATLVIGLVLAFFARFVPARSDLSIQGRISSQLTSDPSDLGLIIIQNSRMTDIVLDAVENALQSGHATTEEVLIDTPFIRQRIPANAWPRYEELLARHLPRDEVELILLFMKALGTDLEGATAQLEAKASKEPPDRFANQILGQIASSDKLLDKAYPYFLKEGNFPEAKWAREQAVRNRDQVGDLDALSQLANDPQYQDAFSPWIRADLAARQQDWPHLVKFIVIGQFSSLQLSSFILATIAMVIWATILMKLCQAVRFDKWTPLLCILGLLLGMLSITPTLIWVMLEDLYLPIDEGEDVLHAMVYYIATVGIREEVCKLLMVLPLVPILIKRGYQLEFLLVSSFVGLGFAYEENFSYLGNTMGTATTARFLTANFLHISLTGMSGLYLCRALGTRAYSFNDFLFVFGIAIVAHGLYDAFLVRPPLDDGGYVAMILFVVFSRYYFKEARELRERLEPVISLSATISFGICLLTSVLLVYLGTQFELGQAVELAFGSFLGSAIILFMFFREFGDTLTR